MLDFWGESAEYALPWSDPALDAEAMRSDWMAVGGDLQSAFLQHLDAYGELVRARETLAAIAELASDSRACERAVATPDDRPSSEAWQSALEELSSSLKDLSRDQLMDLEAAIEAVRQGVASHKLELEDSDRSGEEGDDGVEEDLRHAG